MRRAASGRQIELRHGDHHATIVEVGAGLRSYTVSGLPVLAGYAASEVCPAAAGQLLVPWPNRVADGAYTFEGTHYQLPLDEPARHNAIHGLVRFVNWGVVEASDRSAVLEYRLAAQPGYPFALDLRVSYTLDADGLAVTMSATNRAQRPAPYGAGAHPYLAGADSHVDALELRCPARSFYESDDRGIPTRRRAVAGTAYDFRGGRAIGDTVLDTAFTDLDVDRAGRGHVELTDQRRGRLTELWFDGAFRYIMLFTADALTPPRQRASIAVEPMTCAPDAFNSGDGLRTLAPGETFISTWGIRTEGFTPP